MTKQNFSPRLFSRKGAQLLEYVLLFLVIIAGVVVSLPQVRGQINARIKGYDDAQKDTIRENPLKSPATSLLPACSCQWVDGPCGGGDAGIVCAPNQRAKIWKCDPIHCEPAQVQCIDSAGQCCTTTSGLCGVQDNCVDGTRKINYFCSNSTTVPTYSTCEPDPVCVFSCLDGGIAGPPATGYQYAGLCPGDDVGLSSSAEYRAVNTNACTNNFKCENECAYPFTPNNPNLNGIFKSCTCPDHSSGLGTTCVCDSGYAYSLCQATGPTCPAGYMPAP